MARDRGLQTIAGLITGGSAAAVNESAIILEATIKLELSRPGSGRIYRRGKRGRVHQASAPGEPPAPDYGMLRRTIGRQKVGAVSVRVGSPLARAVALEFGKIMPSGAVLAPRPFMRPALRKAQSRMTIKAALVFRGRSDSYRRAD